MNISSAGRRSRPSPGTLVVRGVGAAPRTDGAAGPDRRDAEPRSTVSDGQFVTSSFCAKGECVAVAADAAGVRVRSTTAEATVVGFTDDEWTAFVRGVKNGEFDLDRLRG
ncbi:hypothetical protein Ae406Ps2_3493c [Pseudonocardia sp. Ae406_Ps2]|nr:hypothetical protein Ae331Ps2_2435 [Pseudonocardia sp. Ae331_Ps2]OLM03493.1 hypothetical protein Ae406Ps2_3493c [Pseudonocardia sp. Ae406_Ps2]